MSVGTTQQTQNICITFVQCWTSVEDAGPTLHKCYSNALRLLGSWDHHQAGPGKYLLAHFQTKSPSPPRCIDDAQSKISLTKMPIIFVLCFVVCGKSHIGYVYDTLYINCCPVRLNPQCSGIHSMF